MRFLFKIKKTTKPGLLLEETDIVESTVPNETSLQSNYEIYKKLSSLGVLSTGRVAQQLAIRKTLRTVERSSMRLVLSRLGLGLLFLTCQNRQNRQNCQFFQRLARNLFKVVHFIGNGARKLRRHHTWIGPVICKSSPSLTLHSSASTLQFAARGAPVLNRKQAKESIIGEKKITSLQNEWHNYTGFLVAFSAVVLNKLRNSLFGWVFILTLILTFFFFPLRKRNGKMKQRIHEANLEGCGPKIEIKNWKKRRTQIE